MGCVDGRLLERTAELEVLVRAVDDAAEGRSSVVLLLGEAGIGKTSLVRAFLDSVADRARVLVGSCDDLLTPRTFGPLRDAADEHAGPLADALADDSDQEAVYQALRRELQPRDQPTVLVVEDLHWADDATLDALRYVCRRLQTLTATGRPDLPRRRHRRRAPGSSTARRTGHPTGAATAAAPAEPRGVVDLAAETGVDVDGVFTITRGNPFFVTEVLASPDGARPRDGGRCRDGTGPPAPATDPGRARTAGGRAVPRAADAGLGVSSATSRCSRMAEQRRILEVQGRRGRLPPRAGPARAAAQHPAHPTGWRCTRTSSQVLLEEDHPDLSRVVHHAVAAGDVDTVLSKGQEAARQAARAGSHRQALAHYEQVVKHLSLLAPPRCRRASWSTTAGSSTSRSAGTTRSRRARRALTAVGAARRPGGPGEAHGRALPHRTSWPAAPSRRLERGASAPSRCSSRPATSTASRTPRPTSARCRP